MAGAADEPDRGLPADADRMANGRQILVRVVVDQLDHDRRDGLVYLRVDGVSHGADRQFLTCVPITSSLGSCGPPPGPQRADAGFVDQLTDAHRASIKAVSVDMCAG